MWNSIKTGFGLAIGLTIGKGVLNVAANKMLKNLANDDEHMADAKVNRPESYEILKKYRTKKTEESVEEEESQ